MEQNKPVIILGGGISGLSAAWYLEKAGVPFIVIEKEPEAGGVIKSSVHKETVLDFGPNSIRDRDGQVQQLAKDLDIEKDVITISEAFKTRYIVKNGKLSGLSPSPLSLLSTNLLSFRGKLRLLMDLFIPVGNQDEESAGEFLERRLGKEVVDNLADPFLSGIYGGDIYRLSKKIVFPTLAAYETAHGSVIGGAFKARKKNKKQTTVLTFRKGIQQLTNALKSRISENIRYENITALSKGRYEFTVHTEKNFYQSEQIISCIPAYSLAEIVSDSQPELSGLLEGITYSPMLSTQLIFKKSDVDPPEKGFGFLVPSKENYRLLGAIWKSAIFPELSSDKHLHFSLMTGGRHDHAVLRDSLSGIEEQVTKEFKSLMNFEADPVFRTSRLWKKAIPQFEVGYGTKKEEIRRLQNESAGLHIGGNFMWGVSVPDCIKGSETCVKGLLSRL